MGNMHLVTGYQGQEHVTAADHGSLYAAIFGSGGYVLDRGNKLAASLITSNQVRIADGDLVIQGRHVRLNEGKTVDLTIENGAQGYKRNDLIVARYTRNASTGIEDANLVVIKGNPSTSSAVDPEYNNGDILNESAEIDDFPLYRIPLDGVTVGTPVQLFDVAYLVTLGSDKKVPAEYLPAMNYIPTSQKGAVNGVASLDNTGKVPSAQLPSMNYIPTSQKGVANGVATLTANGRLAQELEATTVTVSAEMITTYFSMESGTVSCKKVGGAYILKGTFALVCSASNTSRASIKLTFPVNMSNFVLIAIENSVYVVNSENSKGHYAARVKADYYGTNMVAVDVDRESGAEDFKNGNKYEIEFSLIAIPV